MTRGGASDSEDSILSHITVAMSASPTPPPAIAASSLSRSSVGASSLQSTPPTSLDGSTADFDATKKTKGRQVSRARSSLSTLASQDDGEASASKRKGGSRVKSEPSSKTTSRAVSGATLVEGKSSNLQDKLLKELQTDAHFAIDDDEPVEEDNNGVKRRVSRRSQIGIMAGEATQALAASTSSLGKRARDALDAVKEKTTRTTRGQSAAMSPPKKPKYESTGRLFPNLPRATPKIEEKKEEPVAPAEPEKPKRAPRVIKKYQTRGLYAGQKRDFKATVKEATNKKKSAEVSEQQDENENSVLPLPMFGAYKRLTVDETKAWSNFKLPADILVPLRKEQNPKDWSRLNKNRFIGDAAATWDSKGYKKLDNNYCYCQTVCDDNCINRASSYECNEKICAVGPDCGNRPFAELAFRSKSKNFSRLREGEKPEANLYGEGIETQKTEGRGFGVRAMRTFKPGQVVVEYCGEVITQEEADRRMNVDYKDKKDYYLMDFHDGMIIDATRGSICRFVNHSCDPNCKVEKWIVNGEPRMALFAGEDSIMTGEELTYDYNFEVFSQNSKQECLCGSENCRGVLGPKPKERPSKTKQIGNAIKGAFEGAKRKVEQMIGGDHEDEPKVQKKRVKIDPKEMVNKFKKQIGSSSVDAVAKPDPKVAQANKDKRAQRAAERIAREQAERDAEDESKDDVEVEVMEVDEPEAKPKKAVRKRSSSFSAVLAVSDIPRSNSRKSASPAKRMNSIKQRAVDTVKTVVAAASSTPAPRTTSATPLLKSSSSASASAPPKSMKQSRLSFGTGSFGFNVSPKKKPAADEDGEDAEAGPAIPKRGSSLKKAASGSDKARSGGAKSVLKGVSKVAAAAKVGAGGDKAIRKTIRTVSGAE